ncbi:MAG: T9SS type A sorting domain-containing protein, partial [Gemmatimonadaceae bacterium]|nr:T9SS type A sorting domain-containing protein [Chitinophagaceae bacterium]
NITASYTLLNAYGSYSPTGTITGFAWTQVSGPNTAAMANANSSTPSISNMINGAYTFKLTVTDNLGATGTAQTTVTVSGVGTPLPPVAVAGPAQAISSATTSLNAWGSYSPTGTITGFSWAQLSGPNTATMVNANSSTPTISGMKNGIYLFELTVTDNLGVTAKARTTVSVTNVDVISQPVAFAGDPQTVSSNWVLLNAFGSYSPNGPIVSFTWSILQAPNTPLTENMNSSTPTISNLTQGQYKFILTVTDSAGLSATNTTEVNVLTGALPVEITFFKGQRQGEEILLEWATATEQNNDFFAVERSEDGINFVSIGNVKGAGTTNAVTNYSFKDTKPAKGNLYYRLRQVDLDLHSKLSKVVVINASGRKLIEDIYPNPVNDRLVVSIQNDSKGNGSIVIYDLSGRVAKKQLIRKDQAAFNTTIQVNDLVPGLYIVEVKVGSDYKIMQKVVKQ